LNRDLRLQDANTTFIQSWELGKMIPGIYTKEAGLI